MRDITVRTARLVFGPDAPVGFTGNSGDSTFYWAQTLWIFVFAVAAAAVWSAVDRRREHYNTLYQWFLLFIRIVLGAQMLYYGLAKAIPTQFPEPSLITLVTPVGNVSLQGLLWTSIGASPAYQIFTGLVEVVAGVLLLIPATTVLGAAVSVGVMVEILVLNLTYDVGLKQISFHLLLMSLFLLTPLYGRIAAFLWPDRATGKGHGAPLFQTARSRRLALVLQIALSVYFLGMYGFIARSWWWSAGGGTPRSPLYGIWNVRQLSVDGVTQPAILNDYDRRWRRLIFDLPNDAVFQRTDDSFARYIASIDVSKQTLALTRGSSRTWISRFSFQRPAEDRLILEGEMDDHQILVELDRVELDTFRLLESDFRWIRPPDPSTVQE
jgi:uncharacterized membrane protein YphA (DoxX/SURF4 family)